MDPLKLSLRIRYETENATIRPLPEGETLPPPTRVDWNAKRQRTDGAPSSTVRSVVAAVAPESGAADDDERSGNGFSYEDDDW